jgi:hypothetical protein
MNAESIELTHESRSSIEVHRDAKGIYSWTIKLYFGPGGAYEDAEEVISEIDHHLQRRYLPKGSAA